MTNKNCSVQVDILIITYNQENYISQAIESAIKQTYLNCKIIVSDDCSTDNNRVIIDEWHEKFPNRIIKVYNENNLGITKNCNSGLEFCNGHYFVIMGGDDVLYPQKIEKQLEWFEKNPKYVLCGHSLDLINHHGNKIGRYKTLSKKKGISSSQWINSGMLHGCLSVMIKRIHNPKIKFDDRMKYSSDLKFFIDFLSLSGRHGYLDKCLGAYRKTEFSITAKKWHECMRDTEIMYEILIKEADLYLKKYIKSGKVYVVDYGYALMNFFKKNYILSIKGFVNVIIQDPFLYKAYFRLLQVLITYIFSRK